MIVVFIYGFAIYNRFKKPIIKDNLQIKTKSQV